MHFNFQLSLERLGKLILLAFFSVSAKYFIWLFYVLWFSDYLALIEDQVWRNHDKCLMTVTEKLTRFNLFSPPSLDAILAWCGNLFFWKHCFFFISSCKEYDFMHFIGIWGRLHGGRRSVPPTKALTSLPLRRQLSHFLRNGLEFFKKWLLVFKEE